MNTNQPDAASPSSLREDFCAGRNPNVAALQVFADDQHHYLLPYAQFLYAEMTPNPALEKQMDAPPQRLVICFAEAEVTVLGSGLAYLERGIQQYELEYIKPADRRYAVSLKTHVASATVTFTKDHV